MFDPALSQADAKIPIVTSSSEENAPECMIDGRGDTFWMSTGMFPQEFVLSFAKPTNVNKVNLTSYNIREFQVEKSNSPQPEHFEPVKEMKLEHQESRSQVTEITISGSNVNHLRFTIQNGFDHFVCVHKLSVDGKFVE